ncbi:MAG: aminopeptidase [Lachnospiraceae bacterium]|nr:aminopeptidase [Lachnospiraceae bacterium]
MEERWTLCIDRIEEIASDPQVKEPFGSYFRQVASFLLKHADLYEKLQTEKNTTNVFNESTAAELYGELEDGSYVNSHANPAYAVSKFGKSMGQLLSFVYTEMFSLPTYTARSEWFELLIRFEWFVELYCIFESGMEDSDEALYHNAWECCYWFVSDYMDVETERRVGEKVEPSFDFAYRLIMERDLTDLSYLYRYGEYISDNEIETAKLLNAMPEAQLQKMADTYTEGYRIGFIKGNKDISIKEVVNIIYPIGFEQVVKRAIHNFETMGLKVTMMPNSHSIFHKRGTGANGYYSTSPNRQFDYDHREDDALFLDKKLVNRKLEVLKEAYIRYEAISKKHGGPAWIEVFGEKDFKPEDKEAACTYDEKQQKLVVSFAAQSGKIINTYIPGEERSFTIIAYPIPEIGKDYEAIMEETIALNTLPYETYEQIQQVIIDALDTCKYVKVEGMNGNETDLHIELCKLEKPGEMTKFENCVADVNIPVGEVFTSPTLQGTEGVLHVKRVYLRDLSYDNLKITFQDGMVTDYSCTNYEDDAQNKKYIKDHVLQHYNSLPMGEFAVGTNTTAYVMGRKYGIEDKLPILIAEKTGPHFAVGDTCYSHAEDVAVYNPDGKEIVARDNEISLLRKDEEKKENAYFQCHTDITIPYDELGRLYGVTEDGKEIDIIVNGRFVLQGTAMLNEPFKD